MEDWKKYKDFNYEVSNFGNVRRILKNGHKQVKVQRTNGRSTVGIWKNNIGKTLQISRLVAELFADDFTPGCVVMHLDNNPMNNHISNLKCGNQSENIKQCYTDNRRDIMRHESHPMKKLSKDDVVKIRHLFNEGYTASDILNKLEVDVAKTTLYSIKQNKSWTDL